MMGKLIIIIGLLLILIGILLHFGIKLPFGKLPGDIIIKKEGYTFYFPIVTSIIISLLLSLLFYFFKK